MVNLGEDNLPENTYYYPRPEPGEKIPIQVLNFRRLFAAWSPELKRTLYFEKPPEDENLKRLREIVLLKVYDWLAGREGLIELNDAEFEQFMQVYEAFLEKLGEIQYLKRKKGRKTENLFELKESPYVIREVKKGPFSDKL
ncbi:hypothetical protein SAMN02910340_00849 [Methanosarcina thermophila]|uniref:Uncharacterized protein n=1 Tax=Methanosarcina thermophila TaxID=2210 RepID=A0A1I6YGQ5_METTE|nr:hypothetical protein [Methanosarcina thermophila]NLU56129.1 hypothetical protein [Methanosarcina thermophila]BAW29147.1 conserved hypothetical protein [Methanosarcina thermophila]SFT49414.1 hypothetical protein SAMN02910340_00849 [Methanosarcina thermophila]